MKKVFFIFLLIFVIVSVYLFNSSYRYSLEAKTYYEFGEYQQAYQLAKKAYKLDKYNRMAFTILTQSQIAKEWDEFIKNSQKYFNQIETISNKETISKSDKIRIKMMLEIIIGEYKNLPNSKLTNKSLINKAKKQYIKAKELYDGIFKKRT